MGTSTICKCLVCHGGTKMREIRVKHEICGWVTLSHISMMTTIIRVYCNTSVLHMFWQQNLIFGYELLTNIGDSHLSHRIFKWNVVLCWMRVDRFQLGMSMENACSNQFPAINIIGTRERENDRKDMVWNRKKQSPQNNIYMLMEIVEKYIAVVSYRVCCFFLVGYVWWNEGGSNSDSNDSQKSPIVILHADVK